MKPITSSRLWPDKKAITALLILPKPGIVALVIVSGMTGLFLGSSGKPDPGITFWTLVGLAMSTAGAATLNNFIDRDIDSVMERTNDRSIPSGYITANQAYIIGTLLVLVSLIILKLFIGPIVTLLTGFAVFTYVVLYSIYLKRSTPLATHIGGIAGALPPLIGYVAARGEIDTEALILFLIIVVWQQPHFWALALKYREDYAKAGVPILPVAKGVWATKVRLFWYTLALLPIATLPYFYHMAGIYYLITATIAGIVYLAFTIRFIISSRDKEMLVFFLSIAYLALVFGAMVFDMV